MSEKIVVIVVINETIYPSCVPAGLLPPILGLLLDSLNHH